VGHYGRIGQRHIAFGGFVGMVANVIGYYLAWFANVAFGQVVLRAAQAVLDNGRHWGFADDSLVVFLWSN